MTLRDRVIDKIIEIEGGFVDDPADSGGATKYGVTERVARQYGYTGPMKDMPRAVAEQVYAREFWNKMMLDRIERLSESLVEELADTAVNLGRFRAGVFLQRCLNVLNDRGRLYQDIAVDGAIGNKTLSALERFFAVRGYNGEQVLLRMLNSLQGAFYIELAERREKDEKFVYGWFMNRVKM